MKELELRRATEDAGKQQDGVRAQFHYLLNEVVKDNLPRKSKLAPKRLAMFNLVMGLYYSMAAVAYFNVPMQRLLERARLTDALRDAVSVDKLVLLHPLTGNAGRRCKPVAGRDIGKSV